MFEKRSTGSSSTFRTISPVLMSSKANSVSSHFWTKNPGYHPVPTPHSLQNSRISFQVPHTRTFSRSHDSVILRSPLPIMQWTSRTKSTASSRRIVTQCLTSTWYCLRRPRITSSKRSLTLPLPPPKLPNPALIPLLPPFPTLEAPVPDVHQSSPILVDYPLPQAVLLPRLFQDDDQVRLRRSPRSAQSSRVH